MCLTKRIALKLRFYEYRQRLEYKCKLNKTGLKVIDERYTSKICSKCKIDKTFVHRFNTKEDAIDWAKALIPESEYGNLILTVELSWYKQIYYKFKYNVSTFETI